MLRPRLCVVGLGKLGSPLAAILARKGFDVIGVDAQEKHVRAVNDGKAPVEEPILQDYITAARHRLRATMDYRAAVENSDITFVVVPTPSESDGAFSNRFVLAAIAEIGRALRNRSDFHLVVITSTVMPGSTGGVIKETLESTSGRRVGEELGLCYSPEFIALGSVVRDMLNPDFVLIGESDAASGAMLERIYAAVCENAPPIHRMNLVNAEITKISVNTFVTTKISFANMLAELCEHLPEADAEVVGAAVGADSRIGRKYFRGAIGYGGPCFPRDNRAFAALSDRLGVGCELARATDSVNNHQVERLFTFAEQYIGLEERVAVLGLSYKPQTNVVEQSQGVILARYLAERGQLVTVYDPLATESAAGLLDDNVLYARTLEEAVANAGVVLVMTAWPEFGALNGDMLRTEGAVVIDPWRSLDSGRFASPNRLVYPGRGT